jgi:hypothetical protein
MRHHAEQDNVRLFAMFSMARCAAAPVHVAMKRCHGLEAIVRQRHAPQSLVMRARIILMAEAGIGVRETAGELDMGRTTVQRWRKRWRASEELPFAERLCDAPRPGAPPTVQPERLCEIIALACEPPSERGRPLTHWTHASLPAAATASGIVEHISAHSVGRFPREVKLKRHRTRGWINTPRDADFAAKCRDVCQTYELAPARAAAFTPKHASWRNQIEMWFSMLARKVIRRGNFTLLDDLQAKITRCIDFFSKTMAEPFRWTYDGKPLAA